MWDNIKKTFQKNKIPFKQLADTPTTSTVHQTKHNTKNTMTLSTYYPLCKR